MQVLKLAINMQLWDATINNRDFVVWQLQVGDGFNVEDDYIS